MLWLYWPFCVGCDFGLRGYQAPLPWKKTSLTAARIWSEDDGWWMVMGIFIHQFSGFNWCSLVFLLNSGDSMGFLWFSIDMMGIQSWFMEHMELDFLWIFLRVTNFRSGQECCWLVWRTRSGAGLPTVPCRSRACAKLVLRGFFQGLFRVSLGFCLEFLNFFKTRFWCLM